MDKRIAKLLIAENQSMIQNVALQKRHISFEPHSNYVLVGLRRAGKSYLLYQRAQELIAEGHQPEEILYFTFEDDRLENLQLADLDIIKQAYEEMYAFQPIFMLDEIQIIDGWEKFARRLADQKYRVYITGSNAKMLSSEISTTLGGRFMVQSVYPFSFIEYLQAQGISLPKQWEYLQNSDIKRTFNEYLRIGGLPELAIIDKSFKREWLSNLYNKIYFGDLISRYSIRNPLAMKTLIRKLAESVKQPQSFNRLANLVSSVAGKVKSDTITDYLEYIKDTCMIFSLENIASKLQERMSNKKYYFIDNGFLSLFLFDPETSLLENQVAIHLHEKYGDDLFFYHENVEVDFCLFENKQAIQVSYSIMDSDTKEREVKALVAYHKRYPESRLMIITMDEETDIQLDHATIEVVPIWKWMLKE